jgi:Uma2 family endonuclease
MATGATLPVLTLEEFLEWERLQADRYELVDGLIRAMTGGTVDHNTIVQNLVVGLRHALRGGPCRVFSENLKVIVAGTVLYPDVVVTCTAPEPKADAVSEPVLIVEVLSPSTHEIDRGRKWLAYQQIPALRQYVLVSQDDPRIEIYRRTDEGWSYVVVTGLAATVTLEPAALATRMADVYEASSVATQTGST